MRSDDHGSGGTPSDSVDADPTQAAGSEPPVARSRGRLLPAVVIPLLLALLAGTLFAVDRSGPAAAGGAAARFLPADGHAARFVDAEGSVDAVEHARLIGVEGIFTAPDVVASSVLASTGDAGVTGAQLWRETLTTADGAQYSDLYLVDSEGISEVGAWGGPVGFTFEPALLVMPSDVAPGGTWSSSGSAFGDGVLTYRAEYRASAPPATVTSPDGREVDIAPDCLQIEGTLVVEQPGSGALLDSSGTSIWCPGLGRVQMTGEQNGQAVASALADHGAGLTAATAAPDPAEPEPEASPAQPGNVTPLDAVAVDPFFGDSVKQGAVTVPPAVTADGRVLIANDRGDDLQAWRLGDGRATLAWVAHPGGVIVSVAAAGDLALATTSDRAVHAYDPIGRRLWSWHGAELALSAPVDAGRGPLIATRDGRIALLGSADGAEQWTGDLGADTRGDIVVAGEVVVAADERGRLNGIDPETGEVRWRKDIGLVESLAASPDGAALYAATFDNEVLRLDPSTGETEWDDGFVGILQSITATADGVVVATDEETVAYSATGTEAWTAAGGDALPVVGGAPLDGSTVAVDGRSITLRSSNGEVAGEWRLPADATTDDGHTVGDDGDLVLVDSFLRFWRMEAR